MAKEDFTRKAQDYLAWEENEQFRREIEELLAAGNEKELGERFWRELDFGTGGLRGVIGGGFNRMNSYVIRKATQGLSNYIKNRVPENERSVAVSFDSRHFSDLFAEETARVLAANGITAWLFPELRPTPQLSYAVREKGCCAGVMVTASHNPAAYNGYKVFWSDGAQVVPPHDRGIIAEVRKVEGKVEAMDLGEAESVGLIRRMGREDDEDYISMVCGQSLRPELVRETGGDLNLVYTPLHGAGAVVVEAALTSLGFDVVTVPEQREPDGDFPTVEFPNPEIAPALEMALELAKSRGADIVMATDPDVDRLGIAVPEGDSWTLITGNRLGALLADYIFRTRREKGEMPAKPAFVNTIVTSELQNKIASSAGVADFRVLTGFKYIGEKIRQFEADGSYEFLFGGEESYGYLVGTRVRDKDAVSAAAMTAEMALWNRSRGFSVIDHLQEIWSRCGYWEELLISENFEGQEGQALMGNLMAALRDNPPRLMAGKKVVEVRDYREGTTLAFPSEDMRKDIELPSSDVLQFALEDGSLITARPSGTEPKIKFYASCRSDRGDDLDAARAETAKTLEEIAAWIKERIDSLGS